MAILRSRTTTANKALTQYKDDLDAGSGPGTAKIYSGTMPATPDNAATGTLLAELVLAKPCGVVADKKLTFSAITQDLEANNTGYAGYVRLSDSDGNAIIDGDVTSTAGTGVHGATRGDCRGASWSFPTLNSASRGRYSFVHT